MQEEYNRGINASNTNEKNPPQYSKIEKKKGSKSS